MSQSTAPVPQTKPNTVSLLTLLIAVAFWAFGIGVAVFTLSLNAKAFSTTPPPEIPIVLSTILHLLLAAVFLLAGILTTMLYMAIKE